MARSKAIIKVGRCDFMFQLTKEEKMEVVTNFDHLQKPKLSGDKEMNYV